MAPRGAEAGLPAPPLWLVLSRLLFHSLMARQPPRPTVATPPTAGFPACATARPLPRLGLTGLLVWLRLWPLVGAGATACWMMLEAEGFTVP